MQLKLFVPTLLLMLILRPVSVFAETEYDWIAELPKPWQIKSQQLAEILPQFHAHHPDYKDRLRALSYWRIGTPYEIFNLGEEQAPDLDPIFRLDVSDCTSHIFTTMSLAHSQSWEQSRDAIIKFHYKTVHDKLAPTYESRWHYTSDRILHHPMTPDITRTVLSEEHLVSAKVTLNKKQDDTEFLKLNWSQPVQIQYIPNEQITPDLLSSLPDFVGVAFVKQSYFKMGIITAHEGMLVDGRYLLHAGQDAGETVQQDFMNYYFTDQGAKFDGIMLYDFIAGS